MSKGDHVYKGRPSCGAIGGGYRRPRIQIGFEPEQISEITIRAAKNNRSFAAEVRALVALSLAHEKVVERALGIVRDRRTAPPPTVGGMEE